MCMRSIILILVLGMVFGTMSPTTVRADVDCGTIISPAQIEYEEQRTAAGLSWNNVPRSGVPLNVPVTIHVCRDSDGLGGLTVPQVDLALADLNSQFNSTNFTFFQCGEIIYIDDDDYSPVADEQAKRDELRQTLHIPNTLNVYFANLTNLAGLSSYTHSATQGVLLNNSSATNGTTLSHEVGHYFDLYHTHLTFWGAECPDGSNCTTAGDRLCDTPADPNLQGLVDWLCVYDQSAATPLACSGTYAPAADAIMSYSRRICRDWFSPDQIAKMESTAQTERPELFTPGCPTNNCGDPLDQSDVNNDGIPLSVADAVQMIRYVTQSVVTGPLSDGCRYEMDGFVNPYFVCEPTLGDAVAYTRYFIYGLSAIGAKCDATVAPTSPSDFVVEMPPGELLTGIGSLTLASSVRVLNASFTQDLVVWSITVPLELVVDGAVPNSISLDITSMETHGVWTAMQFAVSDTRKVAFQFTQNGSNALIVPSGGEADLFRVTVNYDIPAGQTSRIRFRKFAQAPSFVPTATSAAIFPRARGEALAVNPSELIWKTTTPCCIGLRGNFDGSPDESVDIVDLTSVVDYLFGSLGGFDESTGPYCLEEADMNGDGSEGSDIVDLTFIVDYLFGTGVTLVPCNAG